MKTTTLQDVVAFCVWSSVIIAIVGAYAWTELHKRGEA